MFAQLGSITFKELFGPTSFNYEGDEAVYAEHDVLGSRPRLKKTGDTLQQITMEIKLHGEFCNPTNQLAKLKQAKDDGTVLPLFLGNGKYINDYVVISLPYVVNRTFDDGTILEATVTLTLREYVSFGALEQKQQAARKASFGIGAGQAISFKIQPDNNAKSVNKAITATNQQTTKINSLVSDFQNNASRGSVIAKKITEACDKAADSLRDMQDSIEQARELQNKFTAIKSVGATLKTAITGVRSLYPFTNPTDLASANTYMQGVVTNFNMVSTPLAAIVGTRQPVN